MLKFRSVSSIVIPPARTGKANNSRMAVIKSDHANNGTLCITIPGLLIFRTVVIKFIAPSKELSPLK